jgi:hypothetical protein
LTGERFHIDAVGEFICPEFFQQSQQQALQARIASTEVVQEINTRSCDTLIPQNLSEQERRKVDYDKVAS